MPPTKDQWLNPFDMAGRLPARVSGSLTQRFTDNIDVLPTHFILLAQLSMRSTTLSKIRGVLVSFETRSRIFGMSCVVGSHEEMPHFPGVLQHRLLAAPQRDREGTGDGE